jgi:hypothetical protein
MDGRQDEEIGLYEPANSWYNVVEWMDNPDRLKYFD